MLVNGEGIWLYAFSRKEYNNCNDCRPKLKDREWTVVKAKTKSQEASEPALDNDYTVYEQQSLSTKTTLFTNSKASFRSHEHSQAKNVFRL